MQARIHRKNESGFTLIEVLMAIAIFSIGLMAVAALQARSLMDTGDVTRKTGAWAILDAEVARIKALPFYTNAAAQAFPAELVDTGGAFGNAVNRQMNGNYTVQWMVDDDNPLGQVDAAFLAGVPAGNYTVCKTIRVVVTRPGEDPATDGLAEAQFIKTWAATGIP